LKVTVIFNEYRLIKIGIQVQRRPCAHQHQHHHDAHYVCRSQLQDYHHESCEIIRGSQIHIPFILFSTIKGSIFATMYILNLGLMALALFSRAALSSPEEPNEPNQVEERDPIPQTTIGCSPFTTSYSTYAQASSTVYTSYSTSYEYITSIRTSIHTFARTYTSAHTNYYSQPVITELICSEVYPVETNRPKP